MKKRLICVALMAVLSTGLLVGCGGGGNDTVVVASKQFTENILLGEMYAQLIEAKTDLNVEYKQNLGGTSVCFPAMEKGEIDLYVEYSGTAYNEILKLEDAGSTSSDVIYETAVSGLNDDFDVTMFEPIGINNTFAIALLRTKAEELHLATMSDLAGPAPTLRFGANHMFYARESDGYDSMLEIYGLSFKEALKMDTSLLYDAVSRGELDVMVVYATDSLLKKYDMTILQDDKEMFPAYHGAPICRNDTLNAHPELNEVLNLLAGRIDDETMQELDYRIDVENQTPKEVAKTFLTDQGLL